MYGLCVFLATMKTIVYVDGFNLYYGALKGTRYKWLNLWQLCHLLLLQLVEWHLLVLAY